jgi:hypothetical protein
MNKKNFLPVFICLNFFLSLYSQTGDTIRVNSLSSFALVKTAEGKYKFSYTLYAVPASKNEVWKPLDKFNAVTENGITDTLYEVRKKDLYGILDLQKGKLILPCAYENITTTHRRRFLVIEKKSSYGLFDLQAQGIIVPCSYDRISTLYQIDLLLVKKGGKRGVFSLPKLQLVLPCEFDYIDEINDNSLLSASKKGIRSIYDHEGKNILGRETGSTVEFNNDYKLAYFRDKDSSVLFCDPAGKVVVSFKNSALSEFTNGKIVLNRQGKYGICDLQGKELVPFSFSYIDILSETRFVAEKEENGKKHSAVLSLDNYATQIIKWRPGLFHRGYFRQLSPEEVTYSTGEFCLYADDGKDLVRLDSTGNELNSFRGVSLNNERNLDGEIRVQKSGDYALVTNYHYSAIEKQLSWFCNKSESVKLNGLYVELREFATGPLKDFFMVGNRAVLEDYLGDNSACRSVLISKNNIRDLKTYGFLLNSILQIAPRTYNVSISTGTEPDVNVFDFLRVKNGFLELMLRGNGKFLSGDAYETDLNSHAFLAVSDENPKEIYVFDKLEDTLLVLKAESSLVDLAEYIGKKSKPYIQSIKPVSAEINDIGLVKLAPGKKLQVRSSNYQAILDSFPYPVTEVRKVTDYGVNFYLIQSSVNPDNFYMSDDDDYETRTSGCFTLLDKHLNVVIPWRYGIFNHVAVTATDTILWILNNKVSGGKHFYSIRQKNFFELPGVDRDVDLYFNRNAVIVLGGKGGVFDFTGKAIIPLQRMDISTETEEVISFSVSGGKHIFFFPESHATIKGGSNGDATMISGTPLVVINSGKEMYSLYNYKTGQPLSCPPFHSYDYHAGKRYMSLLGKNGKRGVYDLKEQKLAEDFIYTEDELHQKWEVRFSEPF